VALGSARIALGRDDGAENGRHQTKLRKLKDAFKGKTALVTGGASGFGAEIVRSYVREGAKVVILDLNVAGAKAVATEAGGGTVAVGGVTSPDRLRLRRPSGAPSTNLAVSTSLSTTPVGPSATSR
jgi:hypothetical protein